MDHLRFDFSKEASSRHAVPKGSIIRLVVFPYRRLGLLLFGSGASEKGSTALGLDRRLLYGSVQLRKPWSTTTATHSRRRRMGLGRDPPRESPYQSYPPPPSKHTPLPPPALSGAAGFESPERLRVVNWGEASPVVSSRHMLPDSFEFGPDGEQAIEIR